MTNEQFGAWCAEQASAIECELRMSEGSRRGADATLYLKSSDEYEPTVIVGRRGRIGHYITPITLDVPLESIPYDRLALVLRHACSDLLVPEPFTLTNAEKCLVVEALEVVRDLSDGYAESETKSGRRAACAAVAADIRKLLEKIA